MLSDSDEDNAVDDSIPLDDGVPIDFGAIEVVQCLMGHHNGDKHYFHKQWSSWSILMTASSTRLGKGGGLLEKPTIEKTTPSRDSEFDLSDHSRLL